MTLLLPALVSPIHKRYQKAIVDEPHHDLSDMANLFYMGMLLFRPVSVAESCSYFSADLG